MVIADFDTFRIAVVPDEADAPLLVDADAPLTVPVPFQPFQVVGWRNLQVTQMAGVVEHTQFPAGDRLHLNRKKAAGNAIENSLSNVVVERNNHAVIVSFYNIIVKRY